MRWGGQSIAAYIRLSLGGDMSAARRPELVLFDVVETLFALDPVEAALAGNGAAPGTLDRFFTRLLRDAFALGATGGYRPFREHAESALTIAAPDLDENQRRDVLAAFGELPAHPEVASAIVRLRAAGIRVAALTNGSAVLTQSLLENNALADSFEAVISVDEVRVWKPRPEPYRYALSELGMSAPEVAMVAVHAWDVHGARAVGLTTGWASRLEGSFASVLDPPDVVGHDLSDVTEGLLALPDR
jgi:2-haloacid dehalogenase